MKFRQARIAPFLLTVLCGTVLSGSLQAQTIGWMDRLFTFREDQKSKVSGASRNARPSLVAQPHYNPTDHVAWSQFYSDPNLVVQDTMSGSASKVMRPDTRIAQVQGGFGMIADRALENARAEQQHDEAEIHIGEPGDGPGMREGSSNLGRKTMVGEPINGWREQADPRLTSRPGDFDYEAGSPRDGDIRGGEVLAETAPRFRGAVSEAENGLPTRSTGPKKEPYGAFLEFNDEGKATRYKVQRGDTLGAIAAQPEVYNESRLWPLIYSANRKVIGSSPNRLKPAMELNIPHDYTEAQAKAARKRSGR